MQAISFCLNGKQAHFRKYYSNSTALSYMIPPITTVKGIIAGLLGYERDTYYKNFNNDKCNISIIVREPIKKITQTMNLLKVESLNQLNGAGLNRTQNNTEFIIPKDIRTGYLSYQIIVVHKDSDIIKKLSELLLNQQYTYQSLGIALALGSANCQGWISDAKLIELKERQSEEENISIASYIKKETIEKIDLSNMKYISLMKEETITEFDENRLLTETSKKEIIVNITKEPVQVKLKKNTKYYKAEDYNIILL